MNHTSNYSAQSTLEAFVVRPCQHLLFLTCVAALLTGCGAHSFNHPALVVPIDGTPGAIRGTAFGGQQPIVGASLQLYAANLTGYGSTAQPLLPANTITTDANGGFNITGSTPAPRPTLPSTWSRPAAAPGARPATPT